MKPIILLVDDDRNTLNGLLKVLTQDHYDVTGAATGYEALMLLKQNSFDIVVSDIKMPGLDGLTLLDEIKQIDRDVNIILITAYSSVQTAIEAMKRGADDYLNKPINVEELEVLLDKVWEKRKLLLQHRELKDRLREHYQFSELIGNTLGMQRIFKTISSVAPSHASILICGETGTGKELVASAMHYHSSRSEGPFIVLHCAALSEGVLESELFGHERGSFTGAIRSKRGRFELAHGGTLFLDEVAEMSPAVQAKLLRVLERGEFERVGGEKTLKVDVRFIAATNKDLQREIAEGRFREELYYRLNVMSISLPPLRERREDITVLADHFLIRYAQRNQKRIRGFSPQAMQSLERHHWPGNVRELENVIERAVLLSTEDEVIGPQHLPSHFQPQPRQEQYLTIPFGVSLKEAEKQIILDTLRATRGKKAHAAKLLGISTRKIEYKLKEWGISSYRQRAEGGD